MEKIGKYRVVARLGQGGMARVLLTMAEGPHGFNKLLVVKELREELAHDPEFLAMFLDEARITARLNHPNIVQTYEVGSDGDRYFIAMEYLEGQPLNAVFRKVGRKSIPLEVHLKVLADVCAALHHAHDLADFDGTPLNVVHRDVSPQNVFITYDGSVKLVDFGIAKAAGASSRTQEGILKGKISYIAPEQSRCEPVDRRADIFAVGLMLWEAIAGRRLVHKEDERSILARRMAGRDPRIRDVVPDVPAELAAICDKAMAAHPEQRYQSAREMQEVLEGYLARSDYRVGAKEIGQIVASAFDDERQRIRKAIENIVKNIDAQREPVQLELQPASLRVTSDSLPRVHVGHQLPSDPPHAASSTALVQTLPKPVRARSLLPAIAAGSALALAALGLVVFVTRSRGDEGAARLPGSAAPSGDAKKQGAAPETIDLLIHYPAGARASLDGGEITANPFSAKVPRDGSVHQLEVKMEGFETDKRTLTYDKNVDLKVELVPSAAAPVAEAPPSTPPRYGGWPRRPPAAPPPEKSSAAPPPPPPRGDDPPPRKPPNASVDIDERNPYKKP